MFPASQECHTPPTRVAPNAPELDAGIVPAAGAVTSAPGSVEEVIINDVGGGGLVHRLVGGPTGLSGGRTHDARFGETRSWRIRRGHRDLLSAAAHARPAAQAYSFGRAMSGINTLHVLWGYRLDRTELVPENGLHDRVYSRP